VYPNSLQTKRSAVLYQQNKPLDFLKEKLSCANTVHKRQAQNLVWLKH
jgi:hypothetical protein